MPYLDANGVHTYYEEHGSGEPMLLLHGGGVGGDSFGDWIGWFAERYLVRVPDRRGQGHTPDVEGPLSYEVMARDTIAFIEAVGPERTHLVGWSDGGNIALLVGASRPDLVGKIVTIGAYATVDGLTPAGRDSIDLAADGSPFSVKLIACWFDESYAIDLTAVAARTLVVAGDDDIVSNAHTASIAESIPNAELAIVPGSSHLVVMEKPDLLRVIFRGFLEADPPETLLPLRRATPG